MKKITFNQLKQVILKDDVKVKKYCSNILDPFTKQDEKDLKEEFKRMNTLPDLYNYLQSAGFKEWEAYELIIKYLIIVPKPR